MAYNEKTNYANERKYLNNLISGGGGNAEWAKNQMKALNSAEVRKFRRRLRWRFLRRQLRWFGRRIHAKDRESLLL